MQKVWWTLEGHAYVKYNRHGFRDVERTLKKPEGTIRIAVLGDSYTQAREVPFETTFVNRAERQLALCNASAGRPIEMLNFGVASFNTPAQISSGAQECGPLIPIWLFLHFYWKRYFEKP